MASTHYRAVWLSDIHLGCKDCKAEQLLNFLDNCTIDTLYLNGDIIDMWALSKQFRWPASHNQLFYRLISLPEKGTHVIYLPGNHDEPAQKYNGMSFGSIDIHREYVHTTAKGKKLLLLHGDQFDNEVCLGAAHAWVGDKGYELLMWLNRWYNWYRSKLGYKYWSLAGYLKSHISGANQAIIRYRNAALDKARKQDLDGIVCGHIHHPEVVEQDGITYCNTGDWVENCTALAEDQQGDIQLIHWPHLTSEVDVNNTLDFVLPIAAKKENKPSKAA